MKGMKIKYLDKNGEEKDITVPYISDEPKDCIGEYDRINNTDICSDVAEILGSRLAICGKSADFHDGDEIIVNGETFTLGWDDIPELEKESYKDTHGTEHEIKTYTVTDGDGNVMDAYIDDWMTLEEAIAEIIRSLTRPRQTPDGDYLQKKVSSFTSIETIKIVGNYTLYVKVTDAAKAMHLDKGDRVRVTVERIEK